MRNKDESNRDTTLEGKHWNGTPDRGPRWDRNIACSVGFNRGLTLVSTT